MTNVNEKETKFIKVSFLLFVSVLLVPKELKEKNYIYI